jgi:hypothetical protein
MLWGMVDPSYERHDLYPEIIQEDKVCQTV